MVHISCTVKQFDNFTAITFRPLVNVDIAFNSYEHLVLVIPGISSYIRLVVWRFSSMLQYIIPELKSANVWLLVCLISRSTLHEDL